MEKVYVMFGDFTFIEPKQIRSNVIFLDSNRHHRIMNDNVPHKEGQYKAIINRVDEIFLVPVKDLTKVCEAGLDIYESYLIPSEYKGIIEMNTL